MVFLKATLTIYDNFDIFWQIWEFLTNFTISDNFEIVKVEIGPEVEVEGSFSMTRTTELGLQNPCTDEEGYSFTDCISSYVDTQVICYQKG